MAGQKNNSIHLVFFVFAIILILLEKNSLLVFLHEFGQKIVSPVRTNLTHTANYAFGIISFTSIGAMQEKILQLEALNAQLYSEAAHVRALEEENKEARRLFGTNLPSSWKFSIGKVVWGLGDSLFVTGEPKPDSGMPVIYTTNAGEVPIGVYIGRVNAGVGGESEVILSTNPSSKIPVIVRDAKTRDRRASGILLGRGGVGILDQVLSGESLNVGDLVLTSGGAGVPPELLVGFIDNVLDSKNTAVRQAEVKLAVEPKTLEYIFFVTKY